MQLTAHVATGRPSPTRRFGVDGVQSAVRQRRDSYYEMRTVFSWHALLNRMPSMDIIVTFVILFCQLAAATTSNVRILADDEVVVTEGERIVLECLSHENTAISWTFRRHRIEPGGRYFIRQSNTTPRSSLLYVRGAQPRDEGEYICHTSPYDHDNVRVVVIRDSSQIKVVKIIEPSERQLTVEASRTFTLKCEAEIGVDIQWLHDDYPITESPRAVITTQRSEMSVTSFLSLHVVQINASGNYACADRRDIRNKDIIQVSVTDAVDRKASVEIVDLSSSTVTIMTSKPIVLRCMTDDSTNVVWYKDDVMVMIHGNYNVTAETDRVRRRRFSLLTKQNAQPEDSGMYTCKNANFPPDQDSVAVTVRDEGEQLIVNSPDRRDVRNMTLQIGRPIDLQCGVRAAGEHVPEWSKDDVILAKDAPDSKYIIKSAIPNELKIPSAERLDAGVYKCSFKAADTGQISGVILFNITLAPCITLSPPAHGSFVHCPRMPVYGDRCTFKCDAGYKLSSKKAIFCEKDETHPNTYQWSGEVPTCIKMTEEDYLNNIATSTSNVLLRVGDPLKLHCRVGPDASVLWTRHGHPLVEGNKYAFKNTDLEVKNTNRFDTGVYECNIRGKDHRIFGIKKFNVSTLTCPRIKPPHNGTLYGCPSHPSYGEACQFRCNHKFKISGSRTRTCELSHSQTETYWTGEMTKCTIRHYDWLTGGSVATANTSPRMVFMVSLVILASLLSSPWVL